jgi:hypothetical protein
MPKFFLMDAMLPFSSRDYRLGQITVCNNITFRIMMLFNTFLCPGAVAQGSGLKFCKPKVSKAEPKPGLSGRARPAHH